MNEKASGQQGPHQGARYAEALFDGQPKTGVGVFDGLSALVAAKWQFDFVWVSSFCSSAAAGLPDTGIIGVEEMLTAVRMVRRSAALPIVVDLDSGHGDPIKVYHVVDAMIRAGATALCIEDNPLSKRCSLYAGYDRVLVPIEEHVARVRAALEAVKDSGSPVKIVARTEALVAGMGVEEALRRATAYANVGAHATFVQSLDATGNEVLTFGRRWERRKPIFIAPTRMASVSKKQFFDAGISHYIFANHGLRAAHAAMDRVMGVLSKAESSQVVEPEISKVIDVATLVGAKKVQDLEALLGMGQQKEAASPIVETSGRAHHVRAGKGARGSKVG
jgi:phosphoenolpyruvate phosphomutase